MANVDERGGLSVGGALSRSDAALRRFVRERIGAFRVVFVGRLLQWPFRVTLRTLAGHIERDDRLIAFGADSDRFADNSAYLFLHMSAHADRRCVWISGSRSVVEALRAHGLEAERRWSPGGIRVAARASWYVFTHYRGDINGWLNRGAVSFNLWHGVGVKLPFKRSRTVGLGAAAYDAPEGSILASIFDEDRRADDWILTTSPMTTNGMAAQFGVPVQRCVEAGYPRNDHLVDRRDPPPELVDRGVYESIRGRRPVIGYFPTFRDGSTELPVHAPTIDEMGRIVGSQGGSLLFKPHEKTPRAPEADREVLLLPKDADLSAYLGLCDVVVTDYSSVATDALLTGARVVLFWPDYGDFDEERGFLFDPGETMSGTVTSTTEELYSVLGDLASIPTPDDTGEFARLWWADNVTPGAAARISAFIVGRLGADQPSTHVGDRRRDQPS